MFVRYDVPEPGRPQAIVDLDAGRPRPCAPAERLEAATLFRVWHRWHETDRDVGEINLKRAEVVKDLRYTPLGVLVEHDDLLLLVAGRAQVGAAAVNTPGMGGAEGFPDR